MSGCGDSVHFATNCMQTEGIFTLLYTSTLVHIQARHPVNHCRRDEIIKIHTGKEEEVKLRSTVKKG